LGVVAPTDTSIRPAFDLGNDPTTALVGLATRLQTLAGSPKGFTGVARPAGGRAARVAFAYEEEGLARACLEAARTLCTAAAAGLPYDLESEVKRLREIAGELAPGPTTAAILAAARARDIPVRRLLPGRSLYQLGHGARLRRIYASTTDRTGVVDQAVSQDKELTKQVLRGIGLPVPEGRAAVDAEDAWAAASEIGPPVVVKPRDYDYGHGIGLNLTTREQVLAAYGAARERSEGVLVERFVPGDDHRVLVIGGRVVAVARRRPPSVVGDGRSTITELVARVNADPRRGVDATSLLRVLRLGEVELATLADQGYGPGSVPPAGAQVLIRRNSHLRDGGTVTDETDHIHPSVAAQAVEAARVLGLDVAGVDIVALDLGQPLEAQGGAILEVNAGPGFDLHIAPWASHPRPVGEAFIASLFPGAETGRIPIVAVTGGAGAPAASRLISDALQRAGRRAGLACADGSFLGSRRLTAGDGTRFEAVRDLLANPSVEAAVCEVTRPALLGEGLAFDHCDVVVILGTGPAGASTEVECCLVGTVPADGIVVLRAGDAPAEALGTSGTGRVVYFSPDGRHEAVVRHRSGSGRAVYHRDGVIYRAHGDEEDALASSAGVPDEAVLAAVAAAWAMDLPPDAVKSLAEGGSGDHGFAG
jgi:cyanophycin synthetase